MLRSPWWVFFFDERSKCKTQRSSFTYSRVEEVFRHCVHILPSLFPDFILQPVYWKMCTEVQEMYGCFFARKKFFSNFKRKTWLYQTKSIYVYFFSMTSLSQSSLLNIVWCRGKKLVPASIFSTFDSIHSIFIWYSWIQ